MCDYSLMSFPNRLARDGEELIVHRFPAGTKGLAAVTDLKRDSNVFPDERRKKLWVVLRGLRSFLTETGRHRNNSVPAVCIPPGARLLLRDMPEHLQIQVGVRRVEEVTFTQLSSNALSYRDAVRFRNGCEILLQQLREGQRVRVLNLSSSETANPELERLTPAA
jgi:hypothetical protein